MAHTIFDLPFFDELLRMTTQKSPPDVNYTGEKEE
jgi:hypothetical protein